MAAVIPATDVDPEKVSPEYDVDADVSSPPATCGPSKQIRAILIIVSFTLSVILAWREADRDTTTDYQYYSDDVYYDQNDRAWNTCQNGGSTAIDPAGGNLCICASGFGGMNCQFGTACESEFRILYNKTSLQSMYPNPSGMTVSRVKSCNTTLLSDH